jgi:hypothetical protein
MRQVQRPPARTRKPTASVGPAHLAAAMLLDSSLATRSDQTRPRWLVYFASRQVRWLMPDRGESHGCDSSSGVADDDRNDA